MKIVGGQGQQLLLDVTTLNVPSVDAYVDGRPQASQATPDGTTRFTLQLPGTGNVTIRLEGFDDGNLVAASRLDV